MTTKKKAQGGSKGKVTTLDARALAIVNDVNGYDGDTRFALNWALVRLREARAGATFSKSVAELEREVRELLDKAERGEYVFDVDDIGAEHVYAAQTVYNILDGTIETPQFVSLNLQMTIHEAGRRTGGELWITLNKDDHDELGDFSVQRMARMFAHHPAENFSMVPDRSLAELVSAVLKHPDTPRELYGAMRREIATMTEPDEVNEHPDVLRVALAIHKAEQGEEGSADAG